MKKVEEVKFDTTSVEESKTSNEKNSKTIDLPGSVEASETGKEADTNDKSNNREEASKGIDLPESIETSIMFAQEASNNIDPEFSNVQRNVEEIQTNRNTHNVKHPHLVALDSTDESLTWQLEGLDPKIRIDKYQVKMRAQPG